MYVYASRTYHMSYVYADNPISLSRPGVPNTGLDPSLPRLGPRAHVYSLFGIRYSMFKAWSLYWIRVFDHGHTEPNSSYLNGLGIPPIFTAPQEFGIQIVMIMIPWRQFSAQGPKSSHPHRTICAGCDNSQCLTYDAWCLKYSQFTAGAEETVLRGGPKH